MMYVINYDLNQLLHNYQPLFEEIQNLGGPWWKYMDRTWIVATHLSVQEVTDRLTKHLSDPDRLLIVRLTSPYNGWLSQEAWDWIHQTYPQWGYY